MGRNKVEIQMQEKLNTREIQPSAQAWDRLDAMLSVAEEKKTKHPFLSFQFIGIAASILVLLTVGMYLFTQKNTPIEPQNNVVVTETKKDSVKNPTNVIQAPITVQKQENKIAVALENKSTINNQQSQITNQRVSINNQKTTNQKQSNPLINHDKPIEYLINSDVAVKDIPKIETKKQLTIGNNKSDDFLLASLDNTANQSANKKSAVKVDAKSLLSQVDGEVEYTFREKVLHKMNKNYKEIKVALANRNNE